MDLNKIISRTTSLSDEALGRYIRVLGALSTMGRLSQDQLFYICSTYVVHMYPLLAVDDTGKYYDPDLEAEVEKARKYRESRSANRKKGWVKSSPSPSQGDSTYVAQNRTYVEKNEKNPLIYSKDSKEDKGGGVGEPSRGKGRKKDVVPHREFYDAQLKLVSGEEGERYKKFVAFLYGENEFKRELTDILTIRDQVSFDEYKKLSARAAANGKNIGRILYMMINNPKKYTKGKVSLYITLINWIESTFQK